MKINKNEITEWAIIAILSFILWYLLSGEAEAKTQCHTDSVGFVTCKDDKGNTMRSNKDSQGNIFFKFDDGEVYKSRKDTQGNIRIDKIREGDK